MTAFGLDNSMLYSMGSAPSSCFLYFFSYTLFPLLLLFDASVNCRSSMESKSKDNSLVFIPLETEQKVSDSVAEGVVLCLEEVLKKCHLGSVDQMAVILRKLTNGAMLSPLEASEEFREGVIRCFRAVLLNLCPCSNDSCPCKQIADRPVLPSENELQLPVPNVSKYNSASKECSLAFIQSEPASAAVGHWLSLMLKACICPPRRLSFHKKLCLYAHSEATRGHRGSSRIRVEALITLRMLVAKVGIADALAFYLPGVVSQLGKVLHASRTMISGAAGSTKALDQAIRALAEYLVIVLEDGVSASICGVPADDISASFSSKPLASFLEDLRHLPVKNIMRDDARDSTESVEEGSIMSGEDSILVNADTKVGPLHINRTVDWLAKTTAHVNKLLSATFPHLSVHPNKKLRVEGKQIDAIDVSSDAQAFFRLLVSSKGKLQIEHNISELFSRLLEKLPQVVLGNEESLALSHAQKLLAITYFAGPRFVADHLLLSPLLVSWMSLPHAWVRTLFLLVHSTSLQQQEQHHRASCIQYLRSRLVLHKESWQSWYAKTISGHLVRQASTAVCILNEMIFGLSDQAITSLNGMFRSGLQHETNDINGNDIGKFCGQGVAVLEDCVQKVYQNSGARTRLIDYIGNVLHEYVSTEVWDLPLELSSPQQPGEDGDISFHAFNDNAVLHQVGHLVLENSDYVIDSVCRQLRHLDVNPHVPNVLATMLSYVGVADKIFPLLEEPMRAISTELEILGRNRHPILTLPFLKAVAEIAKASKHEACELPNEAELYKKDVNLRMLTAETRTEKNFGHSRSNANNALDKENRDSGNYKTEADMQEEWKSVIFKFNDSKRYRRIVGSIAGSCLVAATPLVASADSASCLKSLDVIEDGIMALAKVEEAYKHECETKESIEQVIQSCSLYNLLDTLGVAEDETVENRLLPAMNKIWPYLIACLRNENPVAIRKCSQTISNVVQICGGEFFSRRFHTDGVYIWRLLSSSPFQKKPLERTPLQLPYRKSCISCEDSPSEISNLKVQVSLLNMISDMARNKRCAPSLDAVIKKVSGIVTGMVCSGVKGVQDACVNALVGLASIDPDLIWLLLADVYYSRKKNLPSSPCADFPEIIEILPPQNTFTCCMLVKIMVLRLTLPPQKTTCELLYSHPLFVLVFLV
ncbi:hypothetical protein ACS0TY_030725 [Phlomoides rotata]